jgi:choline dehydrogenase-like flavoprotein
MSPSPNHPADTFDAVVVGSGFGGCMAARELVDAGWRVLMVERGGWVERGPGNWEPEGAFVMTPSYAADTTFRVHQGRRWTSQNLCTCVGGPSVFYGGASFRYREADFSGAPEIVGGSGAAWPVDYAALEPFYTRAERLLGIAGEAGVDPTEPPRSGPYPQPPAPLTDAARRIADAARGLGLTPFRIPLAINYDPAQGTACQACITCDAFACAVGAKNDLATRLVPSLVADGMRLVTGTAAVRLRMRGDAVEALECRERETGRRVEYRAGTYVLAAGALATPHLLLVSGLERHNPGGAVVGRYLMRHCNAMTYGIFPRRPDPARRHHKQIAIHDFYFGDDAPGAPAGKLGNIQQVMTPPAGLLRMVLPRVLADALAPLVSHLTGLLSVAEDQPRAENGVRLVPGAADALGLPRMEVTHHYSPRDLAARAALVRRAKRILRRAGAVGTVTHRVSTFSHALGTVRMGPDERTSALDADGRFRGVQNLYVTDASALPTAAGVNPSLTVAANALRVGRRLAAAGAPARAGLQPATSRP